MIYEEATEYSEGIKIYKCTVCNAEKNETISKLPHTHSYSSDWANDDISHWHECSCGEVSDSSEHTFGEAVITLQPTCAETGKKTLTCSGCGFVRIEALNALGHEYDSEWGKDADNHWNVCSCGEKVNLVAHTFDSGVITKQPTEKEEGTKLFTCIVCGQTKEQTVANTNHTHEYSSEWITDDDNHWHECSCGEKTQFSAHRWSAEVIDEPTEEEEGLTKYTCKMCGSTKEEVIDKLEHVHDFGTTWVTDETSHWKSCACGEISELGEHSGSEATLTELARCATCDTSFGELKQPVGEVITDEMTNQTTAVSPYKQELSDAGKARIVDSVGTPQLILSALVRTDLLINADFLDSDEIEDYFAICKETGLNTIEIVIMWSQIEIDYNRYDFTDVKNYLDYAKKYGLKVNLEWYGSFVDGESHSANVPDYITNNPSTYPMIMDLFDFANYGHASIMDWSNDNLIKREAKAIYHLMNYVYDWNQENGNYNPVIMVQIGQGLDRFARWRIDAYKVLGSDGNLYNTDEAWTMINKYANGIAQGVKYSKYKALTRVEFCEQNAVVNYVRNIKELEYIDMVCPTYLHTIPTQKNGIKNFAEEFTDMAVLNVENWASDENHKHLLTTMAMGGSGYVSYQLSSPLYYPESPNGTLYNRYNAEGETLAEKFVEKNNRASKTKQLNEMLTKAYVAVANSKRTTFAAFGLNNLVSSGTVQKIYIKTDTDNNGILLQFSNPADTLAFVVYDQNYLYVATTSNASFQFTNCTLTVCQKGYFNASGDWESQGNVTLKDNKQLTAEKDVVYRIRVTGISSLPSSSQLDSNGYKGTLDSVRG